MDDKKPAEAGCVACGWLSTNESPVFYSGADDVRLLHVRANYRVIRVERNQFKILHALVIQSARPVFLECGLLPAVACGHTIAGTRRNLRVMHLCKKRLASPVALVHNLVHET